MTIGILAAAAVLLMPIMSAESSSQADPVALDQHYKFSTFLGGSEHDSATAVAVAPNGNIVVVGSSRSADFPVVAPIQSTLAGGYDAVLAVLSPDGQQLLFSTYLGGSGDDRAGDLAIDAEGRVVIVGETESADFPTVHASQSQFGGELDGFVARVDVGSGALLYSSYLGTTGSDSMHSVTALEGGGVAAISRMPSDRYAADHVFPPGRGRIQSAEEWEDILVVLEWRGNQEPLATTSNMPGTNHTDAKSLDAHRGSIFVTGKTLAENLPTEDSAFLPTLPDSYGAAYVCRLPVGAFEETACTYIHPNSEMQAVAATDAGVFLAGNTNSPDFPAVNPVQPFPLDGFGRCCPGAATFVQFDVGLTHLRAGTWFGGSSPDWSEGLTIDAAGNVYVTGETRSTEFPLVTPLHPELPGQYNSRFLTSFNRDERIRFSTYLKMRHGGIQGDHRVGQMIAAIRTDQVVVVGNTSDNDYPVASPIQPRNAGGSDAVISLVDLRDVPTPGPPTPTAVPSTPQPPSEPGITVCPQLSGRVPAAALAAAIASPNRVAGWNSRCYPSRPPSPWNRIRQSLSLRHLGKPYHPLFNPLVFACGCG